MDEEKLRHEWFTLRRESKKIKEAIMNCKTGKQDLGDDAKFCADEDYVSSRSGFKSIIDPDGDVSEDEIDSQYEAFIGSDVE